MKLSQQIVITQSNKNYKEVEHLCHLSKNLYNAGLYAIKHQYEKDKTYLNYYALEKKLREENNIDYRALPTDLSQQTLKLLDKNYSSFFKSLKSNKINHNVSSPKYLKKNGLFTLICTNKDFSKKLFKQGFISPAKSNIKIKYNSFINIESMQQIRFVPKTNYIVMEIIYNANEKSLKGNNNKYLSVDLGLKNLATCTTNIDRPFIINGRPLCSMNQFYNREKSKIQSELEIKNKKKTSKKLNKLTHKRNNKIKDYLHKASRYIIDYAVERQLNTIIIGKNDCWKQDINIGKVNNQNFVQIPHSQFINMIQYKAKLEGINVVITEESYTSKCSFIDKEKICKHESYKGKRTTIKLFKCSNGSLINADVNGSLNIMRKGLDKLNATDDVLYKSKPVSRGFIVNPVKINLSNKSKLFYQTL